MRIVKTIIVLLGIILSAHAQKSIKQYVQKNTIPIKSIDPEVTDYSDLAKIGEAIGDARIVMLGEQDHGDAPTFLAKTRLIKYLHEQKGFNVLAFESDFFGLNFGWDQVLKTSPVIDSFLHRNIFSIWTDCDACTGLFYQYIPATHRTSSPLQISGFDNQMILEYSRGHLAQTIDSLLIALDLPVTKKPEYRTTILPMINMLRTAYGGKVNTQSSYNEFLISSLKEIQQQVSAKLAKDDFWNMMVNNLVESASTYLNLSKDLYKGSNIRDLQMARNLAWVTDKKYPDEKIIVWAASGHTAKQVLDYYHDPAKTTSPMGYQFSSDPAKSNMVYSIGFSSYRGAAGRITMPKTYTVGEPDKNGFENWIDLSYDYSFTDFKKYNSVYPGSTDFFHAKLSSHYTVTQNWNKMFDGIFFIRDMYPCKKMN